MKRIHHPEYQLYTAACQLGQRCQKAVAAWQKAGTLIDAPVCTQQWTVARARTFVLALSHMFQAYNRVLWDQFPYCRRCGGGCCVVGAPQVTPFDALALALLDRPMPALESESQVAAGDCIYLQDTRCAWPADWRPIKCWSFYCLGSGWQDPDSLGEQYRAITRTLQQTVAELLPAELRRYQTACGDPLADHLGDPLDWARTLDKALFTILVGPLNDRYPVIEAPEPVVPDKKTLQEETLVFIASALEQVEQLPPLAPEQSIMVEKLLSDLEQLEWIVAGQPGNGAALLTEMYRRHQSPGTVEPLRTLQQQLCTFLSRLRVET